MDSVHIRRRTETERWLVQRGVPHLIPGYSASRQIWVRARPFLLGVLFLEAALPVSARYSGLSQGVANVASFVAMAVAMYLFNRRWGKRLVDSAGAMDRPELVFFVLAPALITLLVERGNVYAALEAMIFNVVLLGLTYVVVGFGIIPMVRWSLGMLVRHLFAVSRLFAKTLPLLLVLTVFMFINAEIWQVANLVEPPAFLVVSTGVTLVGLSFVWMSSDEIIDDLEAPESWDELFELVGDSPLADIARSKESLTANDSGALDEPAAASPLSRGGRLNLRLLIVVSLASQVFLVSFGVILVYVLLGGLFMNEAILEAWTGSTDFEPIGSMSIGNLQLFFTTEHLRVSGLVGALSGLNVAVSALTDQTYKDSYVADLAGEVQENLAVRRVYEALASDSTLSVR